MRDRSRDNEKTDPQRTHDPDRGDRTVTRRRALELGAGVLAGPPSSRSCSIHVSGPGSQHRPTSF